MSKLLKFKEWLTIPDAARHLSIMFGEKIREQDVLQLGLDGHLKLSVNLVNHARARCGRVSRYTPDAMSAALDSGNLPNDLKWTIYPPDFMANVPNLPEAARGKPGTFLASLQLDDERYLTFDDDKVVSIEGIWDLPMIGAERLDIEHQVQWLTGGPEITLTNLEGPFIQRDENVIWQLQQSFDDNEFQKGSKQYLKALRSQIANEGLQQDKADQLLATYKADRVRFLSERKIQPEINDFYPAPGLPDDAVIIVRTSALYDFQRKANQTITDASIAEDKPLNTKERNTLLTIIAVLCKNAGYDLNRAAKTAVSIQTSADLMKISIGESTIEGHLKRARDAAEARMK